MSHLNDDLAPTPTPTSRRSVLAGAASLCTAVVGLALSPATAADAAPTVRRRTGLSHPDLEKAITTSLGSAAGAVHVTVIDRHTGARHSHGGSMPVEMASTAKVLIGAAFLDARRAAGRSLTAGDRQLLSSMIRVSDNAAANRLWSAAGGCAGLSAVASRCGMAVTAASTAQHSQWGKAQTTSDEQARLVDILVAGGRGLLHPADCATVLGEMHQVVHEQAWGAGIVASRSVSVAVKNGWAPLLPDRRWRVNTVGHVSGDGRDYVVTAYEAGLPSMQLGVAHKNAVVKAVHAALAKHLLLG